MLLGKPRKTCHWRKSADDYYYLEGTNLGVVLHWGEWVVCGRYGHTYINKGYTTKEAAMRAAIMQFGDELNIVAVYDEETA